MQEGRGRTPKKILDCFLAAALQSVTMFNKLFGKILDSSIWLEDTPTRIVWITLLAAMDETGYAHFSALENLAGRARVTAAEAQKAIECFVAPDPNSGDPENDGRRIEKVPGGYMVLNAAKHRAVMNRVIQKEQTRLRVAKHRLKKNGGGTAPAATESPPSPANAPTREQVIAYVTGMRKTGADYTEFEAIGAFLALQAGGWKWGKWHDVADWRAAVERQIQTDRNNQRQGGQHGRKREGDTEQTKDSGRDKGTYNEGKAGLYERLVIKPERGPISDTPGPGA